MARTLLPKRAGTLCIRQGNLTRPGQHIATFIALLLAIGTAAPVKGQHVCDDLIIARAEDQYRFGWFPQTLNTLQPCLRDDVVDVPRQSMAYRLAGLSYIGVDSLEQARSIVARLLSINSRFEPDPEVDNLVFRGIVDDLKPPWYSWLWKGNEWYRWGGRGALVSGVIMAPVLLHRKEVPDLPEAPLDPQ